MLTLTVPPPGTGCNMRPTGDSASPAGCQLGMPRGVAPEGLAAAGPRHRQQAAHAT